MPYQPNTESIGFCNWMLNISKQPLSGPQRIIVESVYNAALGIYPVSDQTWWNFNLFTAWRNKFYEVYLNYASFTAPSLLSGNIGSYNFDGNSNDYFGIRNGVDTAMIYGPSYGKINDGVYFDGNTSRVQITAFNSSQDWTLALWLQPTYKPSQLTAVLTDGNAGYGIYWDVNTSNLVYYDGPVRQIPLIINTGALNCAVLSITAGVLTAHVNGVKLPYTIPATANFLLQTIGGATGGFGFLGAMDIFNVFDRGITDSEAQAFWNGGNGIQAPF